MSRTTNKMVLLRINVVQEGSGVFAPSTVCSSKMDQFLVSRIADSDETKKLVLNGVDVDELKLWKPFPYAKK